MRSYLVATNLATAVTKGSAPRDETPTLAVALGLQRGVERDVDLRALSVSLGTADMRGWGATLDVATGRGDRFRETEASRAISKIAGTASKRLVPSVACGNQVAS